jgi:hypothetical protein
MPYKQLKKYAMKKIGIFAIGALLFVAVSCNKDKTQLEPSTDYTMTQQPNTDIKNGGLSAAPNPTLAEDIGDAKLSSRPEPHNENQFPVMYNPNRTRPDGVRNDEVVNPYNSTEKVIAPPNFHNEYEHPTYHNPAKTPRSGVRNDELINSNTSDL